MTFPLTEDHELIRDTARGWLADWRTVGGLERAAENGGSDPDAWREAARDLGWAGIAIDEDYGGAGLGLLGRAVLMEEMGYALFSAPFFSTCVIATEFINAFATPEQKQQHLEAIASGAVTATYLDCRLNIPLKNNSLSGTADQIVDAQYADNIYLNILSGDDRIQLVCLKPDAQGVQIEPLKTMDQTRSVARLVLNEVSITNDNVLGEGTIDDYNRARYRSYASFAAECVGGAQRCLDMTVEYAKERVQFGRPIASFQAVKHRCADMMIAVEEARSAAYLAASSDDSSLAENALIAKAVASENFFEVAGDAIQMHGGIGFTWEYPLHYYFKRARANRSQYGMPNAHFDELAAMTGLKEGAAS